MNLGDRYAWEAEREDGLRIIKGGDLEGCVRVSLVPADGTGLPRHDFTGLPFKRRFGRAFTRLVVGQFEYLHCIVCQGFRLWIRSTNGKVLVTTEDEEIYL